MNKENAGAQGLVHHFDSICFAGRGMCYCDCSGCSASAVGRWLWRRPSAVPAGATVVLHGQYLLSPATVACLEQFVAAGGHILCVDGPVYAIAETALQRLLGLAGVASYFNGLRVIAPAAGQDLVRPGPPFDLKLGETTRRLGAVLAGPR